LAVVAFDYAAARAHLNSGRDGLSVPFGDQAAFVGAAVALAREPALLENLGRAARQSVERLDSERIYDRLEASFLQLVSGEPSCSTASLAT
ncbi:MAG TPA: glycosyltransferase family 1 protein, partial [Candidatus Competibacter sp.]|nr:glycosyltransferase family 1 protein [Candidatus Competibacter sp.]